VEEYRTEDPEEEDPEITEALRALMAETRASSDFHTRMMERVRQQPLGETGEQGLRQGGLFTRFTQWWTTVMMGRPQTLGWVVITAVICLMMGYLGGYYGWGKRHVCSPKGFPWQSRCRRPRS
jgi:hypothetical protein